MHSATLPGLGRDDIQPVWGQRDAMEKPKAPVLDLSEVGAADVQLGGGKCASLGELFRALVPRGVRAVDGFATTSESDWLLLQTNGLGKRLRELMSGLDNNDIRALNEAGREAGKKIGICGQAPSNYPEFARFLVEKGITSISLNPDTVLQTTHLILEVETELASQKTHKD